MVTGVNASMPTGGVTVGATPPAQSVPQEAVQPPVPQTTVTVTANATTVAATAPVTTTTTTTPAGSPVPAQATAPAPRRSSENRRSNKPIMEKKRRQRINNCLNDLKALLLDAMKKDPARHSKLEKADILEMTVKHFETLQRQQTALASATDPNVLNKFRAGFSECASEVGRFPGLDAAAKRRLLAHLASCMAAADSNAGVQTSVQQAAQNAATTTTQLQVHILPQVDASGIQVQQSNGIVYMNANGTALQLVPTRLSNGNIALVAAGAKAPSSILSPVSSPSSSPVPSSPLPTLIPIPQRTASTASASSSSSSTSSTSTSAASPVAFEAPPSNYREQSQSPISYTRDAATSPASGYTSDPEFDPRVYSPPLQKPLSLVMRKSVIKESIDEKCWRPW
ncbi:protein hairy [Copidosoma floridanum]|uniref:protein hairy n=1 Tax=Copidosoma floridanum TaxID=29053 RepID=UPI0006C98314|nr:protein hairy [Copidosoma floridanum]